MLAGSSGYGKTKQLQCILEQCTQKDARTIINIFVNTVILYDDGTGLLVFNAQDTPLNVDMSEMKQAEKALKGGSFSGLHGAPKKAIKP